jgi:hypothetical protein
MCKTLEELDRKNSIAHERINEKVEIIEKKMATKQDVEKIVDKFEPEIKTATTVSKVQKFLIVLFSTVSLGLVALGIWAVSVIANTSQEKADAVIKSYKVQMETKAILDSIETRMKESNAVMKAFDMKRIMDTVNAHWNKENKFYKNEFSELKRWTHETWKEEIHPAYVLSKQNRVVILNQGKKIKELESKLQ